MLGYDYFYNNNLNLIVNFRDSTLLITDKPGNEFSNGYQEARADYSLLGVPRMQLSLAGKDQLFTWDSGNNYHIRLTENTFNEVGSDVVMDTLRQMRAQEITDSVTNYAEAVSLDFVQDLSVLTTAGNIHTRENFNSSFGVV